MYHFCSSSDASIGKSSNVALTNCFCGLPHPRPKDNLDMSGVMEEIDVPKTVKVNIHLKCYPKMKSVVYHKHCVVLEDCGVVKSDLGAKWCSVS